MKQFSLTRTGIWVPSLVCLSLAVLGCSGSDAPKLFTVSGMVTFDGQPLENGTIALIPVNGDGGSFGGEIKDGKFQIQATAGEKTVMISGYRISETLLGPTGKPDTEQYLPQEYNRNSRLTLQVKDSGVTESSFELESKPSGKN